MNGCCDFGHCFVFSVYCHVGPLVNAFAATDKFGQALLEFTLILHMPKKWSALSSAEAVGEGVYPGCQVDGQAHGIEGFHVAGGHRQASAAGKYQTRRTLFLNRPEQFGLFFSEGRLTVFSKYPPYSQAGAFFYLPIGVQAWSTGELCKGKTDAGFTCSGWSEKNDVGRYHGLELTLVLICLRLSDAPFYGRRFQF